MFTFLTFMVSNNRSPKGKMRKEKFCVNFTNEIWLIKNYALTLRHETDITRNIREQKLVDPPNVQAHI